MRRRVVVRRELESSARCAPYFVKCVHFTLFSVEANCGWSRDGWRWKEVIRRSSVKISKFVKRCQGRVLYVNRQLDTRVKVPKCRNAVGNY